MTSLKKHNQPKSAAHPHVLWIMPVLMTSALVTPALAGFTPTLVANLHSGGGPWTAEGQLAVTSDHLYFLAGLPGFAQGSTLSSIDTAGEIRLLLASTAANSAFNANVIDDRLVFAWSSGAQVEAWTTYGTAATTTRLPASVPSSSFIDSPLFRFNLVQSGGSQSIIATPFNGDASQTVFIQLPVANGYSLLYNAIRVDNRVFSRRRRSPLVRTER